MTKVVLADDERLFTDLVAEVLAERGHRVVATPTDARAAVAAVATERPDLCLIDHVTLGGVDALRLLADVVAAGGGNTAVVVVTGRADAAPEEALARGARGYLHKDCTMDEFLDGLDGLRGGVAVVRGPHERAARGSEADEAHRRAAALTARERECLALIVDGTATDAMARVLGISTMTVRSHVRSLLTKLAVHSRLEAAALAMRHDLLGRRATPRAG